MLYGSPAAGCECVMMDKRETFLSWILEGRGREIRLKTFLGIIMLLSVGQQEMTSGRQRWKQNTTQLAGLNGGLLKS